MRSNLALRRWLVKEIFNRELPRKPPEKASVLKPKPFRSYPYRKWIKSLPSAISGEYGCDPCHSGAHAFGQKASDLTCIPLTRSEHRAYDRDPKGFCEQHGLD